MTTINAERIKLQTTRSPIWLILVVAAVSLGFSAIQAVALSPYGVLEPERAAIGVSMFGVPVLMILSALSVTGEYRTGMIRATFLATPRRAWALTSKAIVMAVVSAVVTAVMVVAAVGLATALVGESQRASLSFANAEVWRAVGTMSLYAVLGAVLAIGLGALLRHTAAVVAVVLLMPFVVEPVLGALPEVGVRVGPWLPFANAYTFTKTPWFQTFSMTWGAVGAACYFAVVAGAVFVLAIAVVTRRDP
ncbi:ABC transporter permease [Mycobacterium sp. CBMA293]|uniref:ABC transporter permease n=1 Tax=unclassified Mycolicibacterium TaxID=2636767 RepID=UPI0012DEA3E5|nr:MULTISPECIES: ABC transporter permease [unclassified Mycolicibacterium]MUL44429.1 ABC transporter permease [Mycolicibacterium sp. CBMA 360]MUL59749.1 ABC transporter permease [Mycolicibacterium sp. CBMA 335]MUL68592.1 ABC transporter permease [Mycolicibacterium sp. CBMA 311]MUL94017.1 ABC transporter permease [Mycolicibacterium sp. CBMA 230]MUM06263.1 ABC transporter permease [Mycolicibacterium sp. CBMA 213]